MKKLIDYKIELVYTVLIVALTIYFAYSTHVPNPNYLMSGFLGGLLIVTWFIRAFALYSGRKISQYSEVIQRISIKERFFAYLILPMMLYVSLLLYVYFNTSFVMDVVLTVISGLLLFILFLNVKSSFSKVYTIARQTRAVFDFICISSFYLLISVIIRLGTSIWLSILIIAVVSLILFWSDIKVHRKESMTAFLISIVSCLFVAMISGGFFNTNIFVVPAVGTLAFYLVLSIWNIRFAGKTKFVDYLLPFLYSILALILILKI